MATFLHRIGHLAAGNPWRVLVGWLVVLATLGASAAAFSQPMSTQFSLPGSDYERVLAELEEAIPSVSGGTSTIVLVSPDGPFTDAEKKAVRDTIAAWEEQDAVRSVTDPFAVQEQLDRGAVQVEEATERLAAGEARIEEARLQVEQGEGLVASGERDLAAMRRQQGGDAPAVLAFARELDDLRAQVQDGRRRLADGERKLAEGEELLETGRQLQALGAETRFVSDDGTAAIAQIQFDRPLQAVAEHDRAQVPEAGEALAEAGVEVSYGQEITAESSPGGGIGEAAGLAVAVLVLVVVLGSLVVAGLPLVVAFLGVAVGVAATLALTVFVELNSVTPTLAVMLGLAVGIDYSLFVINRHRQGLAAGLGVRESIALATGTAGNAVLVAGATVVIALLALLVTGVPLLVQMGAVAAGTVAVTVVAALTLTPALLALVGARATPKPSRRERRGREPRPAGRWVRHVTRHPVLAIAGVVLTLGVMALPALDLRLGLPDGGSEPAGSSAHTAYTTVAREFGAGVNGPLVAVASYDDPLAKDAVQPEQVAIGRRLAAADGADQVVPIGVSEDRRTLAFQVTPEEGPAAESTVGLVHALRDLGKRMQLDDSVELGVTGQTAANIEISERLGGALPLYLVLVVGLSLLLLTAVFRSVVVPVLATAGFLLSVVAGFGAVVAVYQWGWLGGLFGVTSPGAILSFMPILLIGVLFGLAMDYQMFLVSGMHEAHAHGEPARAAVVTGFRNGARIVTAAAVIMISVFGGFVFSEMVMVRPIGFGLAIGVLVDAFLVRMTLVPAAMHLLGERAWTLPRWLDRLLPDLDVEGAALAARRAPAPDPSPVARP